MFVCMYNVISLMLYKSRVLITMTSPVCQFTLK